MIEYIRGELHEASPDFAVVDVGGIGYKLFIPLNLYAKLPQKGEKICLYISTVIREDSHKSYGFGNKEERNFFEKLIEISGIGPKIALALLGHMEMNDLLFSIQRADILSLSKVPGVGKKTAERLIIEIRGKLPEPLSKEEAVVIKAPSFNDALGALVNLGYAPIQAQKALKETFAKHGLDLSLPELISKSLQEIKR